MCSINRRLDLLNGQDGKTLPLSATDESSEGLASDIGRRDVRWMRDNLKQADAEHLDLSWTCDPKPAGKGTSVDFVSERNEVWKRHRVSQNVCERHRVPNDPDLWYERLHP